MKRAMDETNRRRAKQQAHNEKLGVEPQALRRDVKDIMEMGDIAKTRNQRKRQPVPLSQVAESDAGYAALSPQQLEKEIKKLESQMYQYAQNLEFEEAAKNAMKLKNFVSNSL